MKPGQPYKSYIDSAILNLLESGKIHKARTRWWKQKRGGGKHLIFDKQIKYTVICLTKLNIENIMHLQNNFKGKCAALGGGGGGLALGMPNVVGVFIVTLGGCLVAT